MHLLLLGHASVMDGFATAVEMIAGKPSNISAINLIDRGVGEFRMALSDYFKRLDDEPVLILADIKGGTPYNEALNYVMSNPDSACVISGANLPMVLEIGAQIDRFSELDKAVECAIHAGLSSIEATGEIGDGENDLEF